MPLWKISDAKALAKARTEYKTVDPRLAEEVDAWDDMELLCRAGVASKRQTYTCGYTFARQRDFYLSY